MPLLKIKGMPLLGPPERAVGHPNYTISEIDKIEARSIIYVRLK